MSQAGFVISKDMMPIAVWGYLPKIAAIFFPSGDQRPKKASLSLTLLTSEPSDFMVNRALAPFWFDVKRLRFPSEDHDG